MNAGEFAKGSRPFSLGTRPVYWLRHIVSRSHASRLHSGRSAVPEQSPIAIGFQVYAEEGGETFGAARHAPFPLKQRQTLWLMISAGKRWFL
jgi:hypothetical protein